MNNTATFRRNVAAAGLVTTAALSTLSNMTAPEYPAGGAERLAAIGENLTTSAISAAAFALAQLPFLAAVLGIGHLLRGRSPKLSNIGTSLAVLGAFGHAIFGGVALVSVAMADDAANREVYGAFLDDFESSPAMVFAAFGLVGTVLGLILLSVGLWRAGVGPRWVPLALGAFIVVEFVGSAVSEWSGQVSAVIYLVAFTALAVSVWRTPAAAWADPVEEPAAEPATV
jgi:hypothetical protein